MSNYDKYIISLKEAEQAKLKGHTGHFPLTIGVGVLAFLFFCVLPWFIPRDEPATATPAALALATAAPTVSPPATATASPTPFATSTFPPTWTPVYGTPLPAPAVPATQTPLPTHTAAPTYTPPPTLATATERPTQTPQATYTPLATLTLLATYTPAATWTPAPPAATAAEARSPLPDAVYWLLANLACLLALAGAGIILLAARRAPVAPLPIIIQQPPARLASPTPIVTPAFLRAYRPVAPVTPPPAPVTPVQSPPEVAPVTPAKTPVQNGKTPVQNGVGGNGRPVPARISVSIEPSEPAEVDEALMRRICEVWNGLEKQSNNGVIEVIWGSKTKKNSDRNGLVNRALDWGRGQGIVKDKVTV